MRKRKVIDISTKDTTESSGGIELKRDLGLASGISLIVGGIIGSGIFISPKGVLESTGSVGLSLSVWAGCGVISILGSLCYAELGTTLRMSGGSYVYIKHGLGDILAFVYFWICVILTRSASVTIICLAFAEYTAAPIFDNCGPPLVFVKVLAALTIVFLGFINAYSVNIAARMQIFFTIAKVLVLIVIIVGGIIKLIQGNTHTLALGFQKSETSPSIIALAFYDGLFAYDGWDNLNLVIEELKNPKRNLPLSLLISIPLVIVIYLLTNVSYFTVMTKDELLASDAVAVLWANRVLGPGAILVSIGVAFSTFGAANGSSLTSSRLNYVASRNGHFLKSFSYVHVNYVTPLPSILLTTVLAVIFTIPGSIYSLIDIVSFTTWMFYGMSFASLIILRFRYPNMKRPFKVNIIIPIIMVFVSGFLVIAPIVRTPKIEFIYGLLLMFSGLLVYIPFVYFKLRIKFFKRLECWMQLYLQTVPSKQFTEESEKQSIETK